MGDHFTEDGKQPKHRVRFATKIVVASVTAIVAFTIAIFVLEWTNIEHLTNIQIPNELIMSWYAFWTVELVSLASIRKTEIKNKYHREDGNGTDKAA